MVDFKFTESFWSVRHKLSLSFSNVLSLFPSMPSFIPEDTGYFLGHHCVGIQVANSNSPIVSPTLWLCFFCPYIWSDRERQRVKQKKVKQWVGNEESVRISHANTIEHKCTPCWWSRECGAVGVLCVKWIARGICRWTQSHTVPKFLVQSHHFLSQSLSLVSLFLRETWKKSTEILRNLIDNNSKFN